MELDELYWFLEYKPRTETRENVYLITMVSRKPRQIVGHVVSRNRSARTIQRMVDKAEEAAIYCTDGYSGYLDVVFPGKHLFNIHSKRDTFTVEGVNADLRHYIRDYPKFCVTAKSGANRVKFIMGGRRVIDCRLVYNITPVGRDVKTKSFISPLPSI